MSETEPSGVDGDDAVARLQRWEEHGGTWQLVDDGLRSGTTIVALLRCDGGEEADVLRSTGQELRRWLRGRHSSLP